MTTLSSDEIIDRLKVKLDAKSDAELSERLGMHFNSVYNWRRRKTIPWEAVAEQCDLESFIYIVFGLELKNSQDYEESGNRSLKDRIEVHSSETAGSTTLSIDDVLNRLYKIVGSNVQSRVAEYLNVHRAVLSGWKTRGSVPWQELHSKLSPENFFYVMYGEKLPSSTRSEVGASTADTNNQQQAAELEIKRLEKELYKTQGMLEQCQKTNEQLMSELSKPAGTFVTPRERATQ
jgi:hypothetical protein